MEKTTDPRDPEPTRLSADLPAGMVEEGARLCREVLLNLVKIGNELAAMVLEEATACRNAPQPATAAGPSRTREFVKDYDCVTRAVRRTVMLYDKLCDPKKPRLNRIAARKRIIRDVEDAIEANAPEDEQESLHAEFLERLDRPDLDDEIAERAIADIVTDINRDLGIAGLHATNPWKRRIPHDIAIINARAEQVSGDPPSEKLAALLAEAPPRPPKRVMPIPDRGPPLNIATMSDEDIALRLKILGYPREREP